MNEHNHIIETFTEMASRYESMVNSELYRFWGFKYSEFVNELVTDIKFEQNQRLLDIATGTAFIPQTIANANKPFSDFTGLDITYEMLSSAKQQISERNISNPIGLVCASAHAMPFRANSFDYITCCLATHHMDINLLMTQSFASLKPSGRYHIADVGGSISWKIGIIRFFIKITAFFYFLFAENFSRVKAESEAVQNIFTINDWREIIQSHGFIDIKMRELKSNRFWAPNPIIIEASKPMEA